MTDDLEPTPSPTGHYLRVPMSNPVITYFLLGAIGLIWLPGLLSSQLNRQILLNFANSGQDILYGGEVWRLFTAMFLHANLTHLLFNGYALFIFGLEMERLFGRWRFLAIYLLAGLFGNLASLAWRGPDVFSVGASGAIFGVIGMNLAFFLLHRQTFGEFGRQRMMNTLVIIGLNLFFGFTVPGIDNLAHLGGLVAGFALGYGLAPRYQIVDQYTLSPRLADRVSLANRWWVPALGVLGLVTGLWLALLGWR